MDQIKQIIKESIDVKERLLNDLILIPKIKASVDLMTATFKNNGSLWFCGNGGSAADAQHLAAEFTGRFYKDRDPLSAEALHVNTSYLTAVGKTILSIWFIQDCLKVKLEKAICWWPSLPQATQPISSNV